MADQTLVSDAPLQASEPSPLTRYDTYFYTLAADSPELIKTAHALRYQVYCLERKFEAADQHLDFLEKDEFDSHALHGLIFHRPTGKAIGTVRLIVPELRADSLPIESMLRENNLQAADHFPARTTAEVSRFAISNEFRRRSFDLAPPVTPIERAKRRSERHGNLPCLGLVQILLRQSIDQGVTHWAAVMEPTLLRMLASMGIHFTALGPVIEHHGLRQPCYCSLPEMLETLRREQPEYWDIITNAGELACGVKSRAA